jgi:hypothetical protein
MTMTMSSFSQPKLQFLILLENPARFRILAPKRLRPGKALRFPWMPRFRSQSYRIPAIGSARTCPLRLKSNIICDHSVRE